MTAKQQARLNNFFAIMALAGAMFMIYLVLQWMYHPEVTFDPLQNNFF